MLPGRVPDGMRTIRTLSNVEARSRHQTYPRMIEEVGAQTRASGGIMTSRILHIGAQDRGSRQNQFSVPLLLSERFWLCVF
ncbi:hypothetical protein PVK06_037941 [Gossypium arboreum]|uniref:Uncharacterized protein n=1 Tax=Gossypium arboreum TaxID=29729 RepID=A0ABR0MZB2_GOSAR|nr:hypothetical protein PVK06_037941 [Gossypium arboreum]